MLRAKKSLISEIRSKAGVYLGASLSAHNAWLIMRGIDTLFPRMNMMCQSAMKIASWLEQHPRVKSVIYPGLSSHPQHDLAKRQMDKFGGIVVFQVDDIDTTEQRFAHESHLFHYAYSIGHQRSLAVLLKTEDLMKSTYRLTSEQQQEYLQYAGKGLFRLSIGLESVEDMIEDLEYILR